MTDGLAQRFDAAQTIAREAGQLALDYFRNLGALVVEHKGPQDVVSIADRAVEDLIRARLAALFPEDNVLGEEGGLGGAPTDTAQGSEGLWVVDPIDGTACFLAGIPVWCISIAFVAEGEPTLGVIYDPNSDELFAARRGHGMTLNGAPVRTSVSTSLTEGTVALGYSTRVQPPEILGFLDRLLTSGGMFQRNGSGALMLAYVAAGRYLGYYEPHINSWDCLAGIVMVNAAGGWTNDFLAGDGLTAGNPIAAAAPGVADAVRRLIDGR